tara:strand:- start:7199 stop:8101 length:903 start_codon:yes stop_codon:yes gene_type:complete
MNNNTDFLAPVGVSAYARLSHLVETVDALRRNTLAVRSHVYFFSDAPREGDEKAVAEVRGYLKKVDGFASVTVIERAVNDYVGNNCGGIEFLLKCYGKVIFLEDDVVTAPGFLEFVNKGLINYKDDEDVFSIGGHTPNLYYLVGMGSDYYCTRRFHPWGFGIWKDRYDKVESIPKWNVIKKDFSVVRRLFSMGRDMLPMVRLEASGKLNAFDIRACFYMAGKKSRKMILPKQTLVTNIGLDGTGEHCGPSDLYKNHKLWDNVEFNFDRSPGFRKILLLEYFFFYSSLNYIKRFKRRFFKV